MDVKSIDELIRQANPEHPVEIQWFHHYDGVVRYSNTFLKVRTVNKDGEELIYSRLRVWEILPTIKTLIEYFRITRKLKDADLVIDASRLYGYTGTIREMLTYPLK